MQRTILKYGVIGGIIIIVFGWANFFLTKGMSYRAAEIGGYLSIILALICVYFGIRHLRDVVNDGVISFKKALTAGLMISLIPSFFMLISTIIFMITMGDQWLEWAMDNMSEAQRVQYEDAPPFMFNPLFQGIIMFGTVYAIGLIVSLISALLLKREHQSG